jgi:hypothetical protein
MTRRLMALFIGIAAILGVHHALEATLLVPAEFREVVSEATLIVRGTVTDVRSFVVSGNAIDTVATVAIATRLKGEADGFVGVRVPGGEVGRTRYVMAGAPTFRVGQHAVFFLKRASDASWRPIGLTQGVYRVQAEAGTGRAVIQTPVVTQPARERVARGDVRRRALPVAEFESLVRLVLASPPQAIPRSGR